MKTFLYSVTMLMLVLFGRVTSAESSELVAYKDATLVEHSINDGDSFIVMAEGRQLHIRLYFADCPEMEVFQTHDARRVQEQARYFGLEKPERIIWLGRQSWDFTKEVLSKPFTVYTSHSKALGGANSQRIYGFVVTHEGRDLSELLVENGLARSYGVSRERYDGISLKEAELRHRDLEISAMLSNRGIWSESNPNLIAEFRMKQRSESESMKILMTSTARILEEPLNINTASQRDLERVPGIGPVTASRIINHRPYSSVDDLKSVPGIGVKLLENIRPYIKWNGTESSNG